MVLPPLWDRMGQGLGRAPQELDAKGKVEMKGGDRGGIEVLRRLDRWALDMKGKTRELMTQKRHLSRRGYYSGMLTALSATRLYMRKFSALAGLTDVFDEGRKDDLSRKG